MRNRACAKQHLAACAEYHGVFAHKFHPEGLQTLGCSRCILTVSGPISKSCINVCDSGLLAACADCSDICTNKSQQGMPGPLGCTPYTSSSCHDRDLPQQCDSAFDQWLLFVQTAVASVPTSPIQRMPSPQAAAPARTPLTGKKRPREGPEGETLQHQHVRLCVHDTGCIIAKTCT